MYLLVPLYSLSSAPVTLDPNTAQPNVAVSEDLTRSTFVYHQHLPDNPKRFDDYLLALAAEGFNSGTPIRDIEVGRTNPWDLGVITESEQRKGESSLKSGAWRINNKRGEYKAHSSTEPHLLLGVWAKSTENQSAAGLGWRETVIL